MPPLFCIVTRGEIAAESPPAAVRDRVAALCRFGPQTLEKVFSGRPFVLKSGLDRPTADRYLAALAATGLLCQVRPQPEKRSAAPPPPPQPVAVIICPKCGERQRAAESCVRCAIVFEKYRRLQERQELAWETTAAEPTEPRAMGWAWKLLPVALLTAAGAYLYLHFEAGKPDAHLQQIQGRVVEGLRSFGKSSKDIQRELTGKRNELKAYQKFLVDFEKELEAVEKRNETAPICPKTGERMVTRLTSDPRPEVAEKIRGLEEEIRLLESRL